ncbi:MAG: hypothetical protein HPY65_09310 [Syntrophaceae bacterium]|nr:hypothetical protein [Syntrophaceae bacterium]
MVVNDKEIKVSGKIIKIAELKEEWDVDIEDPETFIRDLKRNGIKADIFTFMQRLPESKPRFNYYMEWDSIAAIPITTYDYWIKKQVVQNSRKKIGLAQRKGVTVRPMDFNDELVKGILDIYHETPLLQGKPNRQYRTDFETAKRLNSTFLDRAQFIGAFYEGELIAYIKLVRAGKFMRTMGILAKTAHREKGAMNLLVAKAVEICVEKKMPYLIYAKFKYGKTGSLTLMEFKRNLGFESIILPRYYVPLNIIGKVILKLKLHREMVEYLPEKMVRKLLEMRTRWYEKKYS